MTSLGLSINSVIASGNRTRGLEVLFANGGVGGVWIPKETNVTNENNATSFLGGNIASIANSLRYSESLSQSETFRMPISGRQPENGIRNFANGAQDPQKWIDGSLNGLTLSVGFGIESGIPYVDLTYEGVPTTDIHIIPTEEEFEIFEDVGTMVFASMSSVRLSGSDVIRLKISDFNLSGEIGNPSLSASSSGDVLVTKEINVVNSIGAKLSIELETTVGEYISGAFRIKALQFGVGSASSFSQHNYSKYDIWQPGTPSKYYADFNGVSDYLLSSGSIIGQSRQMTLSVAVARATLSQSEEVLICLSENSQTKFRMSILNGNLVFDIGNSRITSDIVVSKDIAVNYAVKIDMNGGIVSIFENGNLEQTINIASNLIDYFENDEFSVGSWQENNFFKGRIYGLLVINTLLSDAQIYSLASQL